ncbi:MAG: acyltransferase family protein [Janthinobacterium lividum]
MAGMTENSVTTSGGRVERTGGLLAGPSIGAVLDANRGLGPGFDLCRIGLSLSVVFIHSFWVADSLALPLSGPFHPFVAGVLALFFGLSGFLVTGSAVRLRNLRTFLTFRVLRILPALMVEISLSAIILGSLMTSDRLVDYFTDRRFFTYFLNMIGSIHYYLPGMFETNPVVGVVNKNLWTLHPEFISYGLMAALIVTGWVYSRRVMTGLWLAATLAGTGLNLWRGDFEPGFHFDGNVLVYCFLTGVVAFHWRDRIPVNRWLFVAACVAGYGLLLVPHTVFIVQVPLIYIILWLGMQKFPRIELLQRGDYSYGIYLYGFPIQQTIVHLVPSFARWWIIFPLATAITFVIAAFSWHFVEKPTLRLKKYFTVRPPAPAAAALAAGTA